MKSWYASKTLWVNLIAIIALAIQTINASYVISPEIQGGILAIINLILRTATNQQLDWSTPAKPAAGDEEPPHFIPPGTAGFVRLPLLPLLLLVTTLALCAGCATSPPPGSGGAGGGQVTTASKDIPLQTAGKSLLAVKSTIVTAATAVDALCKAGKMAPDKCTQAASAYVLAKPAYDAAVDAYLLWSLGHSDQAGFNRSLTHVQSLAANLLQLAGQ